MEADDLLLRFETWQKEVRREVERQGRNAQALNIILIVGALVAGVQAQLLSGTLALDPESHRARRCNRYGFLGLIVEIAGTFFGAVNAVKLQSMAQKGTRALDRMEECKGGIKIVMKIAKRRSLMLPSSPNSSCLQTPSSPVGRFRDSNINPGDESPIFQSQRFRESNVDNTGQSFTSYTMHPHEDPIGTEHQLEVCEDIVKAMNEVLLLIRNEPPRALLTGIDTLIDRVHSIKYYEDTGVQPADEVGRKEVLTAGNQLVYIQLPGRNKGMYHLETLPLEGLSLVMMAIGVLLLEVSIILFISLRTDILGNSFWAYCVFFLALATIYGVLPFVPSIYRAAFFIAEFLGRLIYRGHANPATALGAKTIQYSAVENSPDQSACLKADLMLQHPPAVRTNDKSRPALARPSFS
ncbi:hypothetical protein BKA70DRAFT_1514778 [Coprinopsis sp. MPI-PUGE-AT-0042]|nr:hypothetical protein BKA70DRAFT_1514778 [Coprinopsis sp. MPI-PUGE-AT-0042]